MPCYNAVNRIPAHGSSRYLSELLRDDLGTVLEDGRRVVEPGTFELSCDRLSTSFEMTPR